MRSVAAAPANHYLAGLLAVLVLAAVALVSLFVGQAPMTVADVWSALTVADNPVHDTIVQELRLPRMLIGLMVGASLGMAGAAMQGLLRNPLAEPGVVGVSGCAGLGAVLVFYSGLAAVTPLLLPLGGMAGAFIAVILLYLLTRQGSTVQTLILAGVAINAFAGAMTSLALNLSSNPFAAYEIVFWLMGSLADRSMDHVLLCIGPMLLGWLLLLTAGRGLDALSLGEETALSLGVNLALLRLTVILGTALAVGAAVAVSGMIGFVGLVVPHVLRPWLGHQPSRLLPWSALGGAVMVVTADILVRLAPTGVELKLGVVTALFGAPFFLLLLHRMRREVL